MRISLLGPLEVRDGDEVIPVPGAKLQALLSALALQANHQVSTSALTDVLWADEPPARSDASLHNHVARLRRTLRDTDAVRLTAAHNTYRLTLTAGELDVDDFHAAYRSAADARRAQDWAGVERHTRRGLDLWRGTPLGEVPPDALKPQAARLVRNHVDLAEWHFDALLRLGRLEGAAARLTALVHLYPLDENLAVLLMRVLHQTGRGAQALEVFQELRRRLVDDLGIEPGAAARQAQAEVLSAPRTRKASAVRDQSPVPQAPGARLPWDVVAFIGRSADLDRVVAAGRVAANGGPAAIHSVSGMPGVGKTAFAVHAAHLLASAFPDGQIFASLYGHSASRAPAEPADVLAALLPAVGVADDRIPQGFEARAALWRDRVAGRRLLLVLDDVHDSAQVSSLIPRFPGTATIVTSRRRLVGLDCADPVALGVMAPEEAAEFFLAKAGRAVLSGADPDVAELVRLCGHLPLAMQLLASRLRHHPAWTVRDLIGDLVRERRRLAALVAEDVSAAAAFDLSYRALCAEAQVMFRRLGLFPGTVFDARSAAALAQTDLPAARRLVEDLEDHHLLEEVTRGRYRMHDLIREHAAQLATTESADIRTAALDRLVECYLHAASAAGVRRYEQYVSPTRATWADEQEAQSWLNGERDNLAALAGQAVALGRTRPGIDVAGAALPILRVLGYWHRAAALSARMVDAAQRSEDTGRGRGLSLKQRAVVREGAAGPVAAREPAPDAPKPSPPPSGTPSPTSSGPPSGPSLRAAREVRRVRSAA
ncbi:AfsR/SARP family transcriptional regulator [Catenulispora subtropica]|uniref:OmpR/PhoB-type domain-containing protein n=1 Tax=Catenulispora subtropica TaxID=450798 RepID=A0ABN2QR64_9ACTN